MHKVCLLHILYAYTLKLMYQYWAWIQAANRGTITLMAEPEKTPSQVPEQAPLAGTVVTPGTPPTPAAPPQTPAPAPESPEAPQEQETPKPAEQSIEADESFTEGTNSNQELEANNDSQSVTWTASEFVHHHKSAGWFMALAGSAAFIAALVYLITRDAVSVGVVIVAAILLGIYGTHEPKQLEYSLDNGGLQIGQKHRDYNEFKSFSIVPEGAFSSIVFMPLKRFAAPTTIYYAPEDEERIVAVLSGHLPFEEPRNDAVDNLMRRIRF